MKVKVLVKTVEKLRALLDADDAATTRFLDAVPTHEKYAILALAMMIREKHDDFEAAYGEAERRATAQKLTQYLIEDVRLRWDLQDVITIQKKQGWEYFELMHGNGSDDNDED
jgi:hypothetical protein